MQKDFAHLLNEEMNKNIADDRTIYNDSQSSFYLHPQYWPRLKAENSKEYSKSDSNSTRAKSPYFGTGYAKSARTNSTKQNSHPNTEAIKDTTKPTSSAPDLQTESKTEAGLILGPLSIAFQTELKALKPNLLIPKSHKQAPPCTNKEQQKAFTYLLAIDDSLIYIQNLAGFKSYYRKLAKLYHPDTQSKTPSHASASESFIQIKKATDLLQPFFHF